MTKRVWVTLVVAACGDGDPSVRPDAPVGPVTITVTVGGGTGAFAYQDGDGPFVIATPQNGVITFRVSSMRYAFARKCGTGTTRITYRAASETTATFASCQPATPTDKLAGGIATTADAMHYLGHGASSIFSSGPEGATTYSYEMAATGTADFIAARQQDFDVVDRLHIERDVMVSGAVTRDLTFANLEAPATIDQPSSGSVIVAYTDVITATSSVFVDDFESPFTFVAFAAGARRPTDRYTTGVDVALSDTSSVTIDRVVDLPQPMSSLPTANLLDPPVVTGNTATWNRIPGTSSMFAIVSTANTGVGLASFSSAWSAAEEAQRWQVPDLGALAGWPTTGGFRGALDSFTLSVTVENKPYPEPGYESISYKQDYAVPTFAPRVRDRAAIRALARARHER